MVLLQKRIGDIPQLLVCFYIWPKSLDQIFPLICIIVHNLLIKPRHLIRKTWSKYYYILKGPGQRGRYTLKQEKWKSIAMLIQNLRVLMYTRTENIQYVLIVGQNMLSTSLTIHFYGYKISIRKWTFKLYIPIMWHCINPWGTCCHWIISSSKPLDN